MKGMGSIKSNMTLLKTDSPRPLFRFFPVFEQTERERFGQRTAYQPIALQFLQEKPQLFPQRPPVLHLDVNLNVVLESLKKEREKREKQQKKVNERILERVYLLERQIEHTGMRLPRLTIQFGQSGDFMADTRPNAAVKIVPDVHTSRVGLRVKPAIFHYPEWSSQSGVRIPWAVPTLTQAIGEMVTAAVQNTWMESAPAQEIWRTPQPYRQYAQPHEVQSGTQTWAAVVRQAARAGRWPVKNQTELVHRIGFTSASFSPVSLTDLLYGRRRQQPLVLRTSVRTDIQSDWEREQANIGERRKAQQVVRQIAQTVALTLQHNNSQTEQHKNRVPASGVENISLTYLPQRIETAAPAVPTAPPSAAQANNHPLPEWATRFADFAAQPSKAGQIEWTAPQAVRRPANIVYREDKAQELPQAKAVSLLSEGELRRTADKVYRMIQERLRRELRRSGR